MKNLILIMALFFSSSLFAESDSPHDFKIMCYNTENFFDYSHDSLKNDTEYLPGGIKGWNYLKYQNKLANISRVISAVGGWDAPALVGLCEVENDRCLRDLTSHSGLKNLGYRYLHHESPDPRGIDVALLYQPDLFKPFHDEAIPIHFPDESDSKTRDILFVSGVIPSGDTLHVFVCHFPSRLGGEAESENKRMFVASVLKSRTDSLFNSKPNALIVIMGDFNDFPDSKSIAEVLSADIIKPGLIGKHLYNMMLPFISQQKGTNKFSGEWGILDQIIVSGNLLMKQKRVYLNPQDVHIFDAGFLLEQDRHFLGNQPFRTYNGMKYQNGFSDHLPVFAVLKFADNE